MTFIINPGSGPVDGASFENAEENIKAFVADLELPNVTYTRNEDADDGGRYGFRLAALDHETDLLDVDMPGIPLENVRYLGSSEGQNIWHFPRLYVDGDSWVWKYTISQARSHLLGEE